MSQILLRKSITQAQAVARQGYVLPASGGEHLIHFRDHGNIFINVGSVTGSDQLALGTQQVTVGAGIPIHRHFQMDEAFYVLAGSEIFILNDVRHSFDKGGTISSRKTLGTVLRIPITNSSFSGLSRLLAWTAFSVRPAIRPVYRQDSSLESRSTRLLGNMGQSSDN